MKKRIAAVAVALALSGAALAQTSTSNLPAATAAAPGDLVQITQGGVTKRAPLSIAVGGVAPLLSNNLADLPNRAMAAANLGIPACVVAVTCPAAITASQLVGAAPFGTGPNTFASGPALAAVQAIANAAIPGTAIGASVAPLVGGAVPLANLPTIPIGKVAGLTAPATAPFGAAPGTVADGGALAAAQALAAAALPAASAGPLATLPGATPSAAAIAALGFTPYSSANPAGFLPATGDGSAVSSLAAGSTSARTQAARAGDVYNVLDYGADPTGAADIGPALRAIAAKLASSGSGSNTILLPAGHYTLSSAVAFTGGAPVLQGQGFTAGPNPSSGTWITIPSTGFVPFTFSGALARGGAVRDIAITEAQPAPAAGWAPAAYDYVFKVLNTLGEVTFDNVLFAGVTRGIYADNSGRLNVRNVAGQFFTAGIEIDDCYDIPRIEHLHAWTYATSSPYVLGWQQANLDTVILRRVDGIFIGDLFSYAARDALYLTSGANGVTTKLYANSIYADQSKYGVWVDGAGVNGQFGKVTTQHNDLVAGGGAVLAGSRGMLITGNADQFQVDQWRSNSVGGPVIDIEGYNNRVSINDFWANTWYVASPADGTPAVMVADTTASGQPANFAQVVGTPFLQGASPLVLFNATTNGGRTRTVQMNSVDGGAPGNELRGYDNTAGNPVSLAAIGSDAKVDLQLQAKSATGSVKLQANGQTVVRIDDASSGADDVLFRSGAGSMSMILEGGDANIDAILTPKGTTGGVRLQANGMTTLRTDNPNGVADDLLVRPGSGTIAVTAEGSDPNINVVLNPKGTGLVVLGTSPNLADNSPNVVTSAWVVGQGYATGAAAAAAAPVQSVAGRSGNVTLGVADVAGAVTSAQAAAAAAVQSVAGRTGAVALGVGDVSGAAPSASPTLTGIPTIPPFNMTSALGPKIALYDTVALQTYGIGINGSEVTLFTGGAVGFRNSGNSAGNSGPLFFNASPTGAVVTGTVPGGSGFARSGTYVLEASTAATTITRMTSDGNAAGGSNCVNLPNGSAYSMSIDITGIGRTTTASAARYRLLDVMLLRGASASATSIVNGVSAVAPNGSVGSGSTASFTAAADTTNGCLALSVTPPNADAWHWAARVVTTEVQ